MIDIVGIGYTPLSSHALKAIEAADVIVTSSRLEGVFRNYEIYANVSNKVLVIGPVEETLKYLKTNVDKAVVLLASGDPLFHGIGRRVIEECGKERVCISPELSSLQVAFSRIKESWDDALFISLHGGLIRTKHSSYVIEDLPNLIVRHPKIGILTDSRSNPRTIAGLLKTNPLSKDITIYVCERLGYHDEQIVSGLPDVIADGDFREPNVVVIVRTADSDEAVRSIAFGLTESEIAHREGLISKDEVRAVIIHKLQLPRHGIMWDIGAGSGSVSIEAAKLVPNLRIYAIERDPGQCGFIRTNIDNLGIDNVTLIEGNAPDALTLLPSPDRVFIGGSGNMLSGIMDIIMQRVVGRVVIVLSASMIETLQDGMTLFKRYGLDPDCSQLSISRLSALSRGNYMKALNPVFILRGRK